MLSRQILKQLPIFLPNSSSRFYSNSKSLLAANKSTSKSKDTPTTNTPTSSTTSTSTTSTENESIPIEKESTISSNSINPSTTLGDEVPIPSTSSTTPLSTTIPPLSDATTISTPPTEALTKSTSLAQQYLDETPDQTGAIPASKTTGARAKGSGSKSSIEKKRQNLTRTLMLMGTVGLIGGIGFLGREWDDDFERMRLVGRTEDLEAVKEAEEGGWKGAVGRGKLRTEDMLDVSFFSQLILIFNFFCSFSIWFSF